MPFNLVNRLKALFSRQGVEPKPASNAKSPLAWIVFSILLALVAQLSFARELVLLAGLLYTVASWIFISNVGPLLSEGDAEDGEPPESLQVTEELPAGTAPPFEPDSVAELRIHDGGENASLSQRWELVRHHWRQLTIHQIVTGSYTGLHVDAPTSSISPSVQPPVEVDELPEPAPALARSPSTSEETPVATPPQQEPKMRPGELTRWSGGSTPFEKPQAVTVSLSGDVLVLDTGRELVVRFAPDGERLGEWSVSGLSELQIQDLAVSPDGDAVYLIDETDRCVYKITLAS